MRGRIAVDIDRMNRNGTDFNPAGHGAKQHVKLEFISAGRNFQAQFHDGTRNAAQKRRIYRAASNYRKKIGNPCMPYRFDLIEVIFSRFGLYAMFHRKGRFGAGHAAGHGVSGNIAPVNYFD